jgi:hypothetical protein
MKFVNPIRPSSRLRLYFIVPIDDETRWKVGRQYDSPYYNHPFWVYLQNKKWWFFWVDVAEYSEPIYAKDDDSPSSFMNRIKNRLSKIRSHLLDIRPTGEYHPNQVRYKI